MGVHVLHIATLVHCVSVCKQKVIYVSNVYNFLQYFDDNDVHN